MVTQLLVAPLVLCTLLAPSAYAQDEADFKGSPTDFLPLQVGNQWTYRHDYYNEFYGFYAGGFPYEFIDPVIELGLRLTIEIPGYPLLFPPPDDLVLPPEDLSIIFDRELTLEITHTETIEGHTYFVFSPLAYDWPPLPPFFLAGQKVRFSDAGVLLTRQQEQDIPLYDFAPPYTYKEYTTPPYPVLYDDDPHDPSLLPLAIRRGFLDARLRTNWPMFYPPPLSFGPAFVARLAVRVARKDHFVSFLANYGLARYEVWEPGFGQVRVFENSLEPVSAVIGGKEIAYPYVFIGTSVQPISWGQLKARHGQEP